jgi:hypothetical protein
MDIKRRRIMANFTKRKKRGMPGPRKESSLASMLQSFWTSYSPINLLQHSHLSSEYSVLPLKIRLASRCR